MFKFFDFICEKYTAMKKIFFFLSLSAILFTACDGNDDLTPYDPNSSQGAIVKKIIESDDSGATLTINFSYNGNKIENFVDSDGDSGVFTYVGDALTRIDYYEGPTMVVSDIFSYNGAGKISSYLSIDNEADYATRTDYTHNADGTVSYSSFWGSPLEQLNVALQGKYFFTGGEVSKVETFDNGVPLSSETYTYDDKNNPWKNVLGLNEAFVFQGVIGGIKHNLLTTSGTSDPHSISYVYNPANFPESSTDISALSGQTTTQYFYE